MRDRNNARKSSLRGFTRYSANGMSNEERNAFERELQKDPFAREASEGYSTVTPEEAAQDMDLLNKLLHARSAHPRRLVLYRIAASAAAIIAIASLYIIIEKPKHSQEVALSTEHVKSFEIAESAPVTVRPDIKENTKSNAIKSDRLREPAPARKAATRPEAEALPAETIIKSENSITDAYDAKDSIHEPAASPSYNAGAGQGRAVSVRAGGKDDAVTASGIERQEKSLNEAGNNSYSPPKPLGGESGFYRYIRENIHRPDTLHGGAKEEVVLTFRVSTNGSIDSINVKESPGKLFSDEAIRLLKSGPRWQPAMRHGKPAEDKVRLRIHFK